MELEEERRSHKERDQCIRKQQIKIDNLNNQVDIDDIVFTSLSSSFFLLQWSTTITSLKYHLVGQAWIF